MHHNRLLARAVFGHIFEAKAGGQVEVELHGRKLPQAPNRVHQLDVNLRPIKGRFAGDRLVLDVQPLQNFFERRRRGVPLIFRSHEACLVRGIPCRKLGDKFVEAEIFQHIARELNAIGNFLFDLLRRGKNVRVVLSKTSNAQKSVHDAGTLIAIHRSELAQPHR